MFDKIIVLIATLPGVLAVFVASIDMCFGDVFPNCMRYLFASFLWALGCFIIYLIKDFIE